MKIFGLLTLILIALIIGSFAYVASTDVPVTPTTVTRDLSTDQLK